jgi:hypothetical protein
MRSFLLISLASSAFATSSVSGPSAVPEGDCGAVASVVDALHTVPVATSYCSSLLSIPTQTITSTIIITSTIAEVISVTTTTNPLTTETGEPVSIVAGTTTVTADAVVQTETE